MGTFHEGNRNVHMTRDSHLKSGVFTEKPYE